MNKLSMTAAQIMSKILAGQVNAHESSKMIAIKILKIASLILCIAIMTMSPSYAGSCSLKIPGQIDYIGHCRVVGEDNNPTHYLYSGACSVQITDYATDSTKSTVIFHPTRRNIWKNPVEFGASLVNGCWVGGEGKVCYRK